MAVSATPTNTPAPFVTKYPNHYQPYKNANLVVSDDTKVSVWEKMNSPAPAGTPTGKIVGFFDMTNPPSGGENKASISGSGFQLNEKTAIKIKVKLKETTQTLTLIHSGKQEFKIPAGNNEKNNMNVGAEIELEFKWDPKLNQYQLKLGETNQSKIQGDGKTRTDDVKNKLLTENQTFNGVFQTLNEFSNPELDRGYLKNSGSGAAADDVLANPPDNTSRSLDPEAVTVRQNNISRPTPPVPRSPNQPVTRDSVKRQLNELMQTDYMKSLNPSLEKDTKGADGKLLKRSNVQAKHDVYNFFSELQKQLESDAPTQADLTQAALKELSTALERIETLKQLDQKDTRVKFTLFGRTIALDFSANNEVMGVVKQKHSNFEALKKNIGALPITQNKLERTIDFDEEINLGDVLQRMSLDSASLEAVDITCSEQGASLQRGSSEPAQSDHEASQVAQNPASSTPQMSSIDSSDLNALGALDPQGPLLVNLENEAADTQASQFAQTADGAMQVSIRVEEVPATIEFSTENQQVQSDNASHASTSSSWMIEGASPVNQGDDIDEEQSDSSSGYIEQLLTDAEYERLMAEKQASKK
jgi:hypothetical protein